jgi:hypothetical protein
VGKYFKDKIIVRLRQKFHFEKLYFSRMKARKKRKPLDVDVELVKLGARIKQLRRAQGYSNMDFFASEHGFPRSQYARYEKGQDLQYSTLMKVLYAFDISISEFFSEGFD